MKTAIVTLTAGGAALGRKLTEGFPQSDLFVHPKFFRDGNREKPIKGSFTLFIGEIFSRYTSLIFIMAAGIVVRSIAPYLRDKKTDPAVVVMDEKGTFVISLLSGHLGGANNLTWEIADFLSATPVITTASDVNDRIAVDTLAMLYHCTIEDFKEATKITAHIVNGEEVGILSSIPITTPLPSNVRLLKAEDMHGVINIKGLIYITENEVQHLIPCDKVVLRPRNLIVGLGCRKGKQKTEILGAITEVFQQAGLSINSIKKLATVDVKKEESGMIEAAEALGVPLCIVSREEILRIEDQFAASSFVKETIGVGAVCEPAALISSNEGSVIIGKKACKGITIAVVKEGEEVYGNRCCRD